MTRKNRLELTWVGKEVRPKLEPRIIVEDTAKSYTSSNKSNSVATFDNLLIHGDNLLALKALETEFAGKVKCIYIDPPYNTGNAFERYEDGLEHSVWMSLMRDRLVLLRKMLSSDGFIFVQIDDNEVAYLIVLMDEIFGRSNRLNIIAVKMSEATGVKMSHARKRMPKQKEYILVYKLDGIPKITPIRLPRDSWNDEYKELILYVDESNLDEVKQLIDQEESSVEDVRVVNEILKNAKVQSFSSYFKEHNIANDERDGWKWENAWRIVQAVGAGSLKQRAIEARTGSDISAVLSARKKLSIFKTAFDEGSRDPRIRFLFADKYLTYNPGDFWTDIKTTGGVGEEGGVYFPKGKKPEALVRRVIQMCTEPGDIVLDSFAGSGTTGAVAHKMGRRWIMVELGEQAETHIVPRMIRVIDGEDAGGVTAATDWSGGGGFRFCRLAPSLLEKDRFGNWVISKEYNAAMLAEAVCKHLGFIYAPSVELADYWRHGHSTETDFIFVTTQSLTYDALKKLAEEVGPKRSLLVCCKAFNAKDNSFPNLTVKKIPHSILAKCEWARDDYSLEIVGLPEAEPHEVPPGASSVPAVSARGKVQTTTLPLFDSEDDGQ